MMTSSSLANFSQLHLCKLLSYVIMSDFNNEEILSELFVSLDNLPPILKLEREKVRKESN